MTTTVGPAAAGRKARCIGRTASTTHGRREELAALAGISVDYLVQLEQGRAARPSAPVVAAPGCDLHVIVYSAAPGTRDASRLGLLAVIGAETFAP